MRAAAWILLLATPAVAQAADVGEIAVIADPGNVLDAIAFPTSTYLERASCAFYQSHSDTYDLLFVFTNKPLNGFTRGQSGWAVKRAARGLGRDLWPDRGDEFCSPRLRHAVKMGDIGSFADDPEAPYTGVVGFTLNGVQLMAHELGHQWMAAVSFLDPSGQRRCLLRGFTGGDEPTSLPPDQLCDGHPVSAFNLHWSYYFSTGSVMYGNELRDLGDGRFEVSSPHPKYSPLDQYLMGLRDPSEVPPMFLVLQPLDGSSSEFPLPPGQTEIVEGERLDFTIQDVIRAEGPRDPPRDVCHLKAAFLLIHEPNTPPTAAEIARVDRYRQHFEAFYAEATDRRGSMDTTLSGQGPGTPECPAVGPPVRDAGASPDVDYDAGDRRDTGADPGPDAAGGFDLGPGPAPLDAGGSAADPGPRVLSLDDGCACRGGGPAPGGTRPKPLALLLVLGGWFLRRRSPARPSSTGT